MAAKECPSKRKSRPNLEDHEDINTKGLQNRGWLQPKPYEGDRFRKVRILWCLVERDFY